MDILLLKLGALGDVLRTTSLLRPLRARYPGARIWWVTSAAAAPLLEGNPFIDRVLTDVQALRAGWKGRFDLVLSLEEGPVARVAAAACRGTLVGVYSAGGVLRYTESSAPYYDMSLLNRGRGGSLSAANEKKAANRLSYAELWLKILGLPVPKDRKKMRPLLFLSQARRRPRPAPIGLNPGAGARWPAKQLSVAAAARLALALERLRRPVLILGGKDEAARNRAIVSRARALGARSVRDAGTGHGLRAFARIVGSCAALVCTDSLAFHLATALGRPVAVLVGPTSTSELDVFGRGVKIKAPGCACFYRPRCRYQTSCLDGLGSGMVAARVGRLLSR